MTKLPTRNADRPLVTSEVGAGVVAAGVVKLYELHSLLVDVGSVRAEVRLGIDR